MEQIDEDQVKKPGYTWDAEEKEEKTANIRGIVKEEGTGWMDGEGEEKGGGGRSMKMIKGQI